MNCNACFEPIKSVVQNGELLLIGKDCLGYKPHFGMIITCDNCGHAMGFTQEGCIRNLTKQELELIEIDNFRESIQRHVDAVFKKPNNLGSYAWG